MGLGTILWGWEVILWSRDDRMGLGMTLWGRG